MKQPINGGQLYALTKLLREFTQTHACVLYIASRLLGREVQDLSFLSVDDWRVIRDEAYPNWQSDDWTIQTTFRAACAAYAEDYLWINKPLPRPTFPVVPVQDLAVSVDTKPQEPTSSTPPVEVKLTPIQKAAQWARDLLKTGFVVLDTETTGLNKGRANEPCQIAVIDQDGTTLLDTLVKPSFPIPADATRIHGITDEMVKDAPTFAEIAEKMVGAVDGKAVVIYNADYDWSITSNANRNITPPQLAPQGMAAAKCAMTWYAQFYGDWDSYRHDYRWQSLANACHQQGIVAVDTHSALGDCRLTLALVKKMAAFEANEAP